MNFRIGFGYDVHRLQEGLGPDKQLFYAGRAGAAAPASGIVQRHVQEQQALVDTALRASAS